MMSNGVHTRAVRVTLSYLNVGNLATHGHPYAVTDRTLCEQAQPQGKYR